MVIINDWKEGDKIDLFYASYRLYKNSVYDLFKVGRDVVRLLFNIPVFRLSPWSPPLMCSGSFVKLMDS